MPRETLQDLHLAADRGPQGLYWRLDGAAVDPAPENARAAPAMDPGQTLSLDTFLNAFYERYWRELTDIGAIALEVETSGACTLRLVRQGGGREPRILQQLAVCGERTITVLDAPGDPEDAGGAVLYLEVQALTGGARLRAGRWITGGPPVQPVALAIVICSFGREEMVAETLRAMAGVAAASGAISQLLVVHQGPSDLERHPAIMGLQASDAFAGKLRILRQANFGGSGGFTRGMIEAVDAGATHVLLMDDDVAVDPAVFTRLTALLGHLKAPTTIGGQMLDLRQPGRLHASHESVDLDRLALINPLRGADLAAAGATALFQAMAASRYNGWWFCCIPAELIRTLGLPLPMFIRHDDTEYGLRTTLSGAALATVPGLFVWHEPFEAKVKPWQAYYDRRNMLITAALHGRPDAARQAMVLIRETWGGLTLHRYEYCWAIGQAAEDYLKGPEHVFRGARERHRWIVAETARHALMSVQDHRAGWPGRTGKAGPLRLSFALLRWMAPPAPATRTTAREARRIAFSMMRTVIRLLLDSGRLAADYRARAPHYSSLSVWTGCLGLAPDGPIPP